MTSSLLGTQKYTQTKPIHTARVQKPAHRQTVVNAIPNKHHAPLAAKNLAQLGQIDHLNMDSLSNKNPIMWFQVILVLLSYSSAEPQLDLPPFSSTPRNYGGYGFSSTQASINSPGNQFDVNRNFQYSSARPVSSSQAPGIYPVSSTPYSINPDISNNGYPNNFGNSRNPSSTSRPYDDRNRDDSIDINNDPNFRKNDPNFVRNDPNYVGANPYDFNRGVDGNRIDDRLQHVNLQQVRDFLAQADDQASKECTNNVAAQWNFETDVNDATQHAAVSFFYFTSNVVKLKLFFFH